jgi:DNA-binding CsgD family transcriptional regulator
VEVEIEAHRANLLRLLEHRMDDARQVAEQAVLTARGLWAHRDPNEMSSRERNAYVMTLQAAFDAAVIEEDTSDMLLVSEEMAQVARGSEETALAAALCVSTALWYLGRVGEAVDHARRVWIHSHERVLPMLTLAAGAALAGKLIDIGEFVEADEVASECVELERRIGGGAERLAMEKVATRSIHELRHLLWFSRGDWRDAANSLEREVALQPDPHYRLHLHVAMVVWLARLGRERHSVDIDRHVAAARTDAVTAGCRRCAREMALGVAEAFARIGRVDDAHKELRAWDLDQRPAEPDDQLWRRHIGALLVLAEHDPATGISELEYVVAERRRLGLVAGLLWARLDLATALLDSDAPRAANELRQAGSEASALGAASEQGRAELGLRRLGVRTWRRGRMPGGRAALDKLSEREQQIATLVAAGNSNPEIANTLFLSRKTVERHVSNILARTGSRNRTELARLVSALTPHA